MNNTSCSYRRASTKRASVDASRPTWRAAANAALARLQLAINLAWHWEPPGGGPGWEPGHAVTGGPPTHPPSPFPPPNPGSRGPAFNRGKWTAALTTGGISLAVAPPLYDGGDVKPPP